MNFDFGFVLRKSHIEFVIFHNKQVNRLFEEHISLIEKISDLDIKHLRLNVQLHDLDKIKPFLMLVDDGELSRKHKESNEHHTHSTREGIVEALIDSASLRISGRTNVMSLRESIEKYFPNLPKEEEIFALVEALNEDSKGEYITPYTTRGELRDKIRLLADNELNHWMNTSQVFNRVIYLPQSNYPEFIFHEGSVYDSNSGALLYNVMNDVKVISSASLTTLKLKNKLAEETYFNNCQVMGEIL